MASPPLESLSTASVWPLEWVRILKDFTFDLGCVAVLALFVQWNIPQLSLKRRIVLFFPLVLMVLFGFRGMPELWARQIYAWGNQLDQQHCSEKVQWIVVLGGGFAAREQLAATTLSRVRHAAKIAKELSIQEREGVSFVVTGGPTFNRGGLPESQLMKEALLTKLPWLAQSRVTEESTSLNTHNNAVHVGKLLESGGIEEGIVLVTSRLHMPRAFGGFKTAGVKVCPMASQDVEHVSEGILNFRNADRTVRVFNEYAGYLGYRARGWIQ